MLNSVEIIGTVTGVTRMEYKGKAVRAWVKTPNIGEGVTKYGIHVVECWQNPQDLDRGYFVKIKGSLHSTTNKHTSKLVTVIRPTEITILSKS